MNIQQYFEEKEQKEQEQTGRQPGVQPANALTQTQVGETVVIPVIEETASIDKKVVDSATVVVHTNIIEEKKSVAVPLTTEEYEVKRIPVNEFVDERPPVRQEGNCIIVPVVEEVLIVQKRLKVVEEVHLVKRQLTETHKEDIVLKKEEVTVERVPIGNNKKG